MAMKRNRTLAFVVLLSAMPIGTLSAPTASAQTPPVYHSLSLRLAFPNWAPMTGKQIEAMFADRDVIVDENYEPAPGIKIDMVFQGGCPPIETFAADGRWQMAMCSRALRIYDGQWSIEPFQGGSQLCVSAVDFLKECRLVWQGPTADQVIMPLADTISSLGPYFNLYRLRPTRTILPPSNEQLSKPTGVSDPLLR